MSGCWQQSTVGRHGADEPPQARDMCLQSADGTNFARGSVCVVCQAAISVPGMTFLCPQKGQRPSAAVFAWAASHVSPRGHLSPALAAVSRPVQSCCRPASWQHLLHPQCLHTCSRWSSSPCRPPSLPSSDSVVCVHGLAGLQLSSLMCAVPAHMFLRGPHQVVALPHHGQSLQSPQLGACHAGCWPCRQLTPWPRHAA